MYLVDVLGLSNKLFGSNTLLAHKMQSNGESAQRSGRNVVDRAINLREMMRVSVPILNVWET